MKTSKQIKLKRNKGFIFLFLFFVIILLGAELTVLSTASTTLMFHSNNVYLHACERNLIISGKNWTQVNLQKDNSQIINNPIELDVNDMNILRSSLNVNITCRDLPLARRVGPGGSEEQYQVQITTICGRAKLNLESDKIYTIEP